MLDEKSCANGLNKNYNVYILPLAILLSNFSVAVSACDSDGGVHAAFRSLIRFLLQKKMPKKIKKELTENQNLKNIFCDPNQHGQFTRNLGSIDDHTYESLKITRVPEVIVFECIVMYCICLFRHLFIYNPFSKIPWNNESKLGGTTHTEADPEVLQTFRGRADFTIVIYTTIDIKFF